MLNDIIAALVDGLKVEIRTEDDHFVLDVVEVRDGLLRCRSDRYPSYRLWINPALHRLLAVKIVMP